MGFVLQDRVSIFCDLFIQISFAAFETAVRGAVVTGDDALAAADAFLIIDLGFPIFIERDGGFRAVFDAGAAGNALILIHNRFVG